MELREGVEKRGKTGNESSRKGERKSYIAERVVPYIVQGGGEKSLRFPRTESREIADEM